MPTLHLAFGNNLGCRLDSFAFILLQSVEALHQTEGMVEMVMSSSEPISTDEIRKQLLALLNGGQAHADFDTVLQDFPVELRGTVPDGLPYSAWQLLEHLRITQSDILNFSAPPTGGYHPIKWPDDYWPKSTKPPTASAWDQSIASIHSDLEKFKELIIRPEADLCKPFRWGDGQNLLREAFLIADHTAYHLGELVVLRRLLAAWRS
jgi:hypothetical protein